MSTCRGPQAGRAKFLRSVPAEPASASLSIVSLRLMQRRVHVLCGAPVSGIARVRVCDRVAGDLKMMSFESGLRRDVTDRAVKANRVVVLDVTGQEPSGILDR